MHTPQNKTSAKHVKWWTEMLRQLSVRARVCDHIRAYITYVLNSISVRLIPQLDERSQRVLACQPSLQTVADDNVLSGRLSSRSACARHASRNLAFIVSPHEAHGRVLCRAFI